MIKFKDFSSTFKDHFQNFPAPYLWGKMIIFFHYLSQIYINCILLYTSKMMFYNSKTSFYPKKQREALWQSSRFSSTFKHFSDLESTTLILTFSSTRGNPEYSILGTSCSPMIPPTSYQTDKRSASASFQPKLLLR